MSEKLIMNGPAKFNMEVYVVNDETQQKGTFEIGIGAFEYPTKESVTERMTMVLDQLQEQGLEGFRLMTKTEAFEQFCIEKVGEPMALPGGPDWDV